jgi:hypothetical protein
MATVNELRDALRDERARVADLRKRVQDNKYLRGCLTSASATSWNTPSAQRPWQNPMSRPLPHGGSSRLRTCSVARGHRSISLRTSWQSLETA